MIRNQVKAIQKISNSEGFTLIEVLIAMTIFSVGILAVAVMQINSINGNASARKVTEASTVASNCLEQLMTLPYTDSDLSTDSHQQTIGRFTLDWVVTDNTAVDNTKTVNVIVGWNDHGTNRNVSMHQIIANID